MAVVLGRKPGGSGGGGAPSGPAGGDLTGTYPNPTLAADPIDKAIVDAKGDLIVATAADTPARLAVGATNGMVLEVASGAGSGVQWDLPSGHEFAYVEITSNVSVTATTSAGAVTVVSAGAVAFDGATRVCIEFYTPALETATTAAATCRLVLYGGTGTTELGELGVVGAGDGTRAADSPVLVRKYLTPTAATHTYIIKAYRTVANGLVAAGTGALGANQPAYVRITKA